MLLPITVDLAHDETLAAEVHGRGPFQGTFALGARSTSTGQFRATDGKRGER